MSLADIGTQRVRSQHLRESYAHAPATSYDYGYDQGHASFGGEHVVVGFTSPTLVYDQMRRMNLDATALDTDFQVNVADAGVKQAWSAWFHDWRAFFDKTLSTSAKIANVFSSDDLRETVNSRDQQLQAFHQLYASQLTASGQLVPPSKSPGAPAPLSAPNTPGAPPSTESWWSIPWWGWALGVIGIGAIGYSFYRAQQRGAAIAEKVAPELLPALMMRDPGPAPIMMPVHMAAQPPLPTAAPT